MSMTTTSDAARARLLAGVLLCAMGADSARAQAPTVVVSEAASPAPTLLLRTSVCEPARYDVAAFVRSLRVEVAVLRVGVEELPPGDDEGTRARIETAPGLVVITCGDAPNAVVIELSDLASGKQVTRRVDLTDVAEDARGRALALAVVALVESSWAEAATDSSPAALPPAVRAAVFARLEQRLRPDGEPEPRGRDDIEPEAQPRVASALPWEASVALRSFPARSTGVLGLSLGVLPRVSRALHLSFGAEALWGRSELADSIGRVGSMDLYWFTGSAGLAWRAPTRPSLDLGPRVQLGYARADGHVDRAGASASSAGGVVLSVLAVATARFQLGAGWDALVGVDLGYTPVGVVFLGDQARLSGMADTTFALRVGVGR